LIPNRVVLKRSSIRAGITNNVEADSIKDLNCFTTVSFGSQ